MRRHGGGLGLFDAVRHSLTTVSAIRRSNLESACQGRTNSVGSQVLIPRRCSRLRIGVDARCLNVEHLRGMGRYLAEVIAHISKCEDVEWHLFADRPDWPLHLPKANQLRTEVFELRGYRFHSWEQIGLPWRIRRARVDVLFCPGMCLPWLQPVPTVVTMHDAVPWDAHGTDYRGGFYMQQLTPWALRKSRCGDHWQ